LVFLSKGFFFFEIKGGGFKDPPVGGGKIISLTKDGDKKTFIFKTRPNYFFLEINVFFFFGPKLALPS
jgi:hypothetical protein